jgi:hypothetical protein
MRSLGTTRARVERLASICPPSSGPLFVHWVDRYERCPSCAADLEAPAQARALAEAVAARAAGDPPPTIVWYSTDELTTCPRCRAALPS